MKSGIKQITGLIIVLSAYFLSTSIAAQNHESSEQIVIESLKLIDVSWDTVLSKILNDATDKVKYGNRPAYYSLCMNRYKEGTIVRLIKSYNDTFDQRSNILGYTLANGHPIVFYRGITNYPIKYADDSCLTPFKLGKFNYNEDAEDVKYYYILGDIYARFSPEVGWIWSDGKPDE